MNETEHSIVEYFSYTDQETLNVVRNFAKTLINLYHEDIGHDEYDFDKLDIRQFTKQGFDRDDVFKAINFINNFLDEVFGRIHNRNEGFPYIEIKFYRNEFRDYIINLHKQGKLVYYDLYSQVDYYIKSKYEPLSNERIKGLLVIDNKKGLYAANNPEVNYASSQTRIEMIKLIFEYGPISLEDLTKHFHKKLKNNVKRDLTVLNKILINKNIVEQELIQNKGLGYFINNCYKIKLITS